MKTKAFQVLAILVLSTGTIFAQDIPESQVPSIIVNSFKTEFPKATDVEWEREGEQYSVEFEIGWFTDYEAWFTKSGKLLKFEKDISARDLPKEIKGAIKTQYKGYRIDDVKKIIENGVETYKVEIEKGNDERDLLFSKDGILI